MFGLRRSPRLVVLLAVLVAVLVGACGRGGSRDDPLAGGPPPEDIRLQPGDRPVRFRLDTAVPEDTKRFLVESLAWAHADLGDSGPLTIHVYSNEEHFVAAYVNDFALTSQQARDQLDAGQFAFASEGGHIWVYLPNFDIDPPEERRLTLFHEYFHTVQSWLAQLRFQSDKSQEQSFVPRWLVEGCAEYVATHAGAARGLVVENERRALIVELARDEPESLPDLETGGAAGFLGGSENAYTVGYLACERLGTTRGQSAVTHEFWEAVAKTRSWDKAFAATFGATPGAFYADFEAYRRTL